MNLNWYSQKNNDIFEGKNQNLLSVIFGLYSILKSFVKNQIPLILATDIGLR
jgi:hypothetical protein